MRIHTSYRVRNSTVALHRRLAMPDHDSEAGSSSGDTVDRGWMQVTTDIASHLPFSAAVEANGFVFVSGQASVDATGQIISGTFEEEMRRALQNVTDILRSAGLGLENVVRVTSYVQDPADGPRYNELYREYFTAPFPARSTITNCLGTALKFEIDVIAVRPA
jgi:2-iminobutanoate/2-iminopropanoate deaminase